MKAYFLSFLIALLSGSSDYVIGQNYATITFVRSGTYIGSACRTDIKIPNQERFNLPLSSVVNYKMYSEGEIPITVEISCGVGAKPVVLNVEHGKQYYVLYDAGSFKEVSVSKVYKHLDKPKNILTYEENTDFPARKREEPKNNESQSLQGTCFLISNEGYFVTNYHCIENAKEIFIKGLDKDFAIKYRASVVASDPSNDLALVKIINKTITLETPPYAIRSSGVAQAEKIYALGFPKAAFMGDEIKITEGIISSRSGVQGDISKFQISAAVNPGNSGGPLIDEHGNLIGVIYAKSKIAESAGYAIKAAYLETFLKNVDNFNYPTLVNTIEELSLPQKVAILKKFIFMIETN